MEVSLNTSSVTPLSNSTSDYVNEILGSRKTLSVHKLMCLIHLLQTHVTHSNHDINTSKFNSHELNSKLSPNETCSLISHAYSRHHYGNQFREITRCTHALDLLMPKHMLSQS